MNYCLYILYSESIDRYYVGISSDPAIRLEYHNTFYKGWTKRGRPWKLVFTKEFASKLQAHQWEVWLKKQKSRSVIDAIINKTFKWN